MKNKGKYLFFDIECSDGRSICSIGYCLVDANLHIISKRDILINPERKFILSAPGHRAKIQLSYPEELFLKQDIFPCFYNQIKKLLLDKKYILLGHSVNSDLNFLDMACNRYNLPKLKLTAFDTQKIFHIAFNRPHIEKLLHIFEELEIDSNNLTFHKSCDDAMATFLITKEMCFRLNMTLDELLLSRKDCLVSSNNKPTKTIKKFKKMVDNTLKNDYN